MCLLPITCIIGNSQDLQEFSSLFVAMREYSHMVFTSEPFAFQIFGNAEI
jgi:hypothetical protein